MVSFERGSTAIAVTRPEVTNPLLGTNRIGCGPINFQGSVKPAPRAEILPDAAAFSIAFH